MARSRNRSQLWLVPIEGTPAHEIVAEVALSIRYVEPLTYTVPPPLRDRIRPGAWVRAPIGRGRRLADGVCVSVSSRPYDHTLRPIAEVVQDQAWLTPGLIELGLWAGQHYHCPPGRVLRAMVPPSVAAHASSRRVAYLRLTGAPENAKLRPPQQRLLDALRAAPERPLREALHAARVTASTAATLLKKGWIERTVRMEPVQSHDPPPARDLDAPEDRFDLNPEQASALAEIARAAVAQPAFRVFLLFGVPGSGKTEVYVRAARAVLETGRQAVIIVPEIALATQLVSRLARRFDRVAVLHSRLTPRARAAALRDIAQGRVDVVLGTRTAAFAPCPRPGLIVVDEEQDSSLKNQAAPRYHARDLAIKRAQLEGFPVVLGTATPALETWHNARTLPHWTTLRLTRRTAGARPPEVHLVAMRDREESWRRDAPRPAAASSPASASAAPRPSEDLPRLISPELAGHIAAALQAAEQVILLHNRRGYAVHLRCQACGLVRRCPRCVCPMVYHRAGDVLRCHVCGTAEPAASRCADDTCGGPLERGGLAIQRLEAELDRLFPAARVMRLDSDAMRRREDYAAALGRFERREVDVLIGTQMVAKGLDFPGVRLVGVIEADAGMWLPDFRAAERTFQLVAQVVGRAGRRAGDSLAVVQAADATLPAVRCAVRSDFEAFAAGEMVQRQRLFYPPFARIVRLVCADPSPARARDAARRLAADLRDVAGRIHSRLLVGEAEPCVVFRLRELARFQVLCRGPRDGSIQRLLHDAASQKRLAPRVARFVVDVDPVSLI